MSAMFHALEDRFLVAPQIALDDVARARNAGVTMIVNNRPDGEDPAAPQGAAIEAAAQAAGMGYVYIPVTHAGFSQNQLDALEQAITASAGPVLAYCRSGTRSTFLWGLVRARMGDAPDALTQKARAAGYDLTPVCAMMDALAGPA